MSDNITEKGIEAAKAGNRRLARQFLDMAVVHDPTDIQAWLWRSDVVDTTAEKRDCLQQVLEIDPDNATAKHGLATLDHEQASPFIADDDDPFRALRSAGAPVQKEGPSREAIDQLTQRIAQPPESKPKPTKRSSPKLKKQQRAILIGMTLGIMVIFLILIAVILLDQPPDQSVSQVALNPSPVDATPFPTPDTGPTRPPTWTPTPTGTPTARPTPRPAPTQLRPLVEEAILIRELEAIDSIGYVLSAQVDLDLYLRGNVDTQSVLFANRFWEELRALGLVGVAVEYDREQILELTGQQLGGFYSFKDKTLYAVTRSNEVALDEYATIVHEYVHALTDMHFDLSRLFGFDRTSDGDLAGRALAEGDATLSAFSSRWSPYPADGWDEYALDARGSPELLRTFGVSPALVYINSFPYVEGWQFVSALYEGGGWEQVNQAYAALPASSEQIMHPEKYLSRDDAPRALTLPAIEAPRQSGYTIVAENDVLGEFILWLVLDEFIRDEGRARAAAAGWGGDVLRVWSNAANEQAYVLLSVWDSEADAGEFEAAASAMLTARLDAAAVGELGVEAQRFVGATGTAYLNRSADRVSIVWGTQESIVDAIVAALGDS